MTVEAAAAVVLLEAAAVVIISVLTRVLTDMSVPLININSHGDLYLFCRAGHDSSLIGICAEA